MNQKCKFLLVALLGMLFFSVTSCNDDEITTIENKQSNVLLSFKRITTEQVNANKTIKEKLSKLNPTAEATIESGKIVYSNDYGFYIDTDYANYVEDQNGKHSYVFRAYRDTVTDKLDNIIFSSQDDGSYKTYFISYDLTAQEQLDLQNGTSIDVTDNTRTLYTIDDANLTNDVFNKAMVVFVSGDCVTIMEVSCTYGNHADGMLNGQPCPGHHEQVWWTNCENTSGGGGTDTGGEGGLPGDDYVNNGDFSVSQGGAGGNGGGNHNNNIYTAPVVSIKPFEQIQREKCFMSNSGLSWDQAAFLNNNQETKKDILEYLESQVTDENSTCPPQEANNKVKIFLNLLLELEENPNILIEIPCNQLPQWLQIAQYDLPQSVLNKISNLQDLNSGAVPNWDIQTLFGAEGAIVNMDFFPVTISQFPNNPNTNQPFTPQEFYNFFRLNINIFTQSAGVSFYPSNITGINESSIWNSNNPLNAILSINMQPDSGSVICSNYNTNSWYFTTLTTPWAFSWSQDDYDGFHPVSGHREFGYYNDINGNYVFYVRGVDRIERGAVFTIADNTPWWDSPFSAADEKWNAMQVNLKNYIETNGGVAVINTDNIYRPNWNDIKDVLSGVKPLSDLGCD